MFSHVSRCPMKVLFSRSDSISDDYSVYVRGDVVVDGEQMVEVLQALMVQV